MKFYFKDILIAALFIALAGMMNAGMDTIKHHWNKSVFKDYTFPSQEWWVEDWTKMYDKDENGIMIQECDTTYINGEVVLSNCKYQTKFWHGIRIVPLNHPLFFDAWHALKVIMIFFVACAVMTMYFARHRITFNYKDWKSWLAVLILIIIIGLAWNTSFNLGYDIILIE